MKRNSLTTAILAGLTGVAGMAGVANAVNVNPDGLGQVLLYPYYTAREGNDTLISVVNTTDQVKAVKVRFLEALNSQEVLDFNLYLSPYDVWTTAVTDLGGDQPGMRTTDTSCTVPYFITRSGGEQPFLNYEYAGDGGPTGIERAASGYIELIEMGNVENATLAAAATHGSGAFNCLALEAAWTGAWKADSSAGISEPTGGLFGSGSILNVDDGTMISYNADAIDGFWEEGVIDHTDPGSLFPNLADGNTETFVFNNGVLHNDLWSSGLEAVDAVLMYDKLFNEYSVEPDLNAHSEWVVTFPTKRFHVDGTRDTSPFTSLWVDGACETIEYDFWDREENQVSEGVEVSPRPDKPGFNLCREANVIRFAAERGTPDHTEILKESLRDGGDAHLSYVNFDLHNAGFKDGWVRFDFGDGGTHSITSLDEVEYRGLPVIGFWANTVQNGALAGGVLSNYGAAYKHRGSRHIE